MVLTVRPKPNLAMDLLDQPLFEGNRVSARPTTQQVEHPHDCGRARRGEVPLLGAEARCGHEGAAGRPARSRGFRRRLRAIRGQTALITGRVEVGNLIVSPSAGGEITLALDDVFDAAKSNDVNLIILQSDSNRRRAGATGSGRRCRSAASTRRRRRRRSAISSMRWRPGAAASSSRRRAMGPSACTSAPCRTKAMRA